MYNITLFGAERIDQAVHSVNIDKYPETNLYSVIDPFSENANKLSDKYGCKIHTVEEEMPIPSIDAVLITSATDTHTDLI